VDKADVKEAEVIIKEHATPDEARAYMRFNIEALWQQFWKFAGLAGIAFGISVLSYVLIVAEEGWPAWFGWSLVGSSALVAASQLVIGGVCYASIIDQRKKLSALGRAPG
jgi:hypothetical protein